MTEFIGEIVGIATAFRERIDMRLMTHDTKVNDDYEVKNGNIDKIKKVKIHGGGGTDFDCVIEYLNKEHRNKTKCLVWLTDGQGTEINRAKVNYPIIWILCPN
jgi:predicted metal-dependent peptidase